MWPMPSRNAENDHNDLRQLLKRIQKAWLQGGTEDLNDIFHEDMVIVGPGF
jgi:hypothetical protein